MRHTVRGVHGLLSDWWRAGTIVDAMVRLLIRGESHTPSRTPATGCPDLVCVRGFAPKVRVVKRGCLTGLTPWVRVDVSRKTRLRYSGWQTRTFEMTGRYEKERIWRRERSSRIYSPGFRALHVAGRFFDGATFRYVPPRDSVRRPTIAARSAASRNPIETWTSSSVGFASDQQYPFVRRRRPSQTRRILDISRYTAPERRIRSRSGACRKSYVDIDNRTGPDCLEALNRSDLRGMGPLHSSTGELPESHIRSLGASSGSMYHVSE